MTLEIKTGTLPVTVRKSSGNSHTNTFKTVLQPVLSQMDTIGQYVFYPTKNLKKDRRDHVWNANNYGKTVGKCFIVENVEGENSGLNFYLAATGLEIPATTSEVKPAETTEAATAPEVQA